MACMGLNFASIVIVLANSVWGKAKRKMNFLEGRRRKHIMRVEQPSYATTIRNEVPFEKGQVTKSVKRFSTNAPKTSVECLAGF